LQTFALPLGDRAFVLQTQPKTKTPPVTLAVGQNPSKLNVTFRASAFPRQTAHTGGTDNIRASPG
jgi:hypothetical protein